MENNNQQIEIQIATETNKNQVGEAIPKEKVSVATSIQNKIGMLCSVESKCCIYKVPDFMVETKKECYQPLVISIGPIFYNDPQLKTMQELKWIFLESFLKKPENACGSLDSYINIVRESIVEIRDCYQEQSKLPDNVDELIEIVVFDAVFLVHLIMFHMETNLPIPQHLSALTNFVTRDIFLEENQVPFFVLMRIFDLAFPTQEAQKPNPFIECTCKFIGNCDILGSTHVSVVKDNIIKDASSIAHLVDFWRKCCCSSLGTQPEENQKDFPMMELLVDCWRKCCSSSDETQLKEEDHFPITAKQLSDAGVKFKENEGQNPLNISFNNGELHIPKICLHDDTEAHLRSLLFFEQYHYIAKDKVYFIDLLVFLESLVESVEDIRILRKNKVLDNQLGSDEAAANLFSMITKYLSYSGNGYYYSSVSKELNAYANKSCNRNMAILKRNYFNHPWAIISVIFATAIFILTVLQTITGFVKE